SRRHLLTCRARRHQAAAGLLGERRQTTPQPQEVFDIAGRTGQRTRCRLASPPADLVRRRRDTVYRPGPQVRIPYDAALAQPLAADLELRLDHEYQVAVGPADRRQRRQHQPDGDERQVAGDQVDRLADPVEGQLADVGPIDHLDPWILLQGPGQLAVAD